MGVAVTTKKRATRRGVVAVVKPKDRSYYTVEDVKILLGIKSSKAYAIMKTCRKELIESGQLIPDYPDGRVPKKYFNQRCGIDD